MRPNGSVEAAAPLYEEIARQMGRLIDEGTYRPGDRLPSVREPSNQESQVATPRAALRLHTIDSVRARLSS
jgi:DNA-binding transcriptional regulator YhcF (GntR family)